MKLLVLGCVLVSAYTQSLEGHGQSQYFERTPNSNLVQIRYIGAQGSSLYDNNQSLRSQRYGSSNQINNQQISQFSQREDQAFNNQRFQSEFNNQNQRLNQQNERFSLSSLTLNQGNQNVNQQNQVAQFSQQNQGLNRQYEPYSFNNYQFANPNLVQISFDENRQQQFLQNQERQSQQFQNRQNQRQNFQSQQNQRQIQLAQRQQKQQQFVQRQQQQRQQQQAQLAQRQQQQAQLAQRQQQQAQFAQRQEQQRQQQQAQFAQRQEQERQQRAQFVQRQEQQRQQQQAQLAQRQEQQRQQQQVQLAQRQEQERQQRQQQQIVQRQQQQFAIQQQNQLNQVSHQNHQFQGQNQNRNLFINNNRGFQQSNFPNRIIPAGPQRQQSGLIVHGSQVQSQRPSRINHFQNQGIQSFQNQFQRGQGFQQSQLRQISGHLQSVDSDDILGVFQPFFIPASASLYEGILNSQFSCDRAGQGFYAEPLGNCQQFHVCTTVHGRNTPDLYRFTFQCVEGEYFDQSSLTCVRRAGPAGGSCAAVSNVQQYSVNPAPQFFSPNRPTPYTPGTTPPGLCYLANNAHFVTGIRRK